MTHISNWTASNSYATDKGSVSPPCFPHEYLVKTLSSSFNSNMLPLDRSAKVLEIGAFGANNLRFLWEKGYHDIYAIEVTQSLVSMCQERASIYMGSEFDLTRIVLGSNLSIPFPDNYFDLIISINTIHYSVGVDVSTSIDLWKSKLQPGGRLFLETAGPQHDYVLDSERMGKNSWLWGKKAGFRYGSPAGFFDSEDAFQAFIHDKFSDASFGRITEKSTFETVDFLTAYCVK